MDELSGILNRVLEAGGKLEPDPDIGVYHAPPEKDDKGDKGGGKGKDKKGAPASKKWVSAGGVVIPSKKKAHKVWVVKPANNYGPWAFPKGRVDSGESLQQAAIREIEEETGLTAKLLGEGKQAYLGKGQGSFSVTHFFLMVQTGGTPTKNDEMEEIRLVTWNRAKQLFKQAGNKRDGAIADVAVHALKAMGLETEEDE